MSKLSITIIEVEYVAFRLARETMSWDEKIPDFSSRYHGKLESCLATPFQGFGGKKFYKGLIDKVAVLFYLMIKNHPFENGNGRWARIVTNIYLRKKGFELILWPEEQMFVANEFREKYISALKAADLHDYQPLIELHHQFVKTN